ncbi:MAG: aminopeptidase P family protein [Clostridiaceae bacterium]|jgi:Xaa-Pro aminopeptidase|nr:aminopeptidase P family protein [Clostridiaceae bacterium]
MTTNEKLKKLRELMSQHNLDAFYVNTADSHQSEYISDHFKTRAWLTGFDGSAGYALVTKDAALLWADGRYFIQAAKQIEGSEFELMKIDIEGFPTLKEYLLDNLPQGGRLGLDGRIVSQAAFEEIAGYLKKKDIELVSNLDLVGDIWTDRPALPKAKAWLHDLKFTGLTAAEKLANVRAKMTKGAYDYALYAGLDDICWLFNFRGGDVPYNPVVLSYALISQDEARLFIDLDKVDQKLRSYMEENGVTLVAYEDLISHLKQLPAGAMVLNRDRIGTAFYTAIPAHMEISSELDYPHMLKAELNEVELANVRNSSLRDSVALTRFIFWVKDQAAQGADLNELNVLDKLYDLRKQGEYFVDISFNPISAYGSNAAMMHYSPTPDNHAKLKPGKLYLIDSGGQYLDGTTDITRTLSLGEVTKAEKYDYTLTLKALINLASQPFLTGTSGHYLDVLARSVMWQHGLDYKCGTGHPFGYLLGVHEGPGRFARVVINLTELKPGMLMTIEPGVYREGVSGVRIENDFVVMLGEKYDIDQYLYFDNLTFVPLDRELIDPDMLSAKELKWTNDFHAQVLEKVEPLLKDEREKEWLRQTCAPLS